jgi:hypothetical protein
VYGLKEQKRRLIGKRRTHSNYLLTGFVFLPLGPGGTAFLAVEDDGCVGVASCCECSARGGAGKAGTD